MPQTTPSQNPSAGWTASSTRSSPRADIHMALKDGNLEISAARNEDRDQKDSAGKTVRRERRTASCRRSFRVGQGVTPEDIQAKFENGVLTVVIPKKDAVPERETGRIEIQ